MRAGSRAAVRSTLAIRNRGSKGFTPGLGRGQSGQGRKRGGTQSGRGRGVQSGRGGRGSSQGGKVIKAGRGRGRGSLRGRGGITILRSRVGALQRGSVSQQQLARQVRTFHVIPGVFVCLHTNSCSSFLITNLHNDENTTRTLSCGIAISTSQSYLPIASLLFR